MEAVCEPCWTCRNRRIQCDQSGTPCAKCQKAGVECFDKRPLRWVKGVAIRGKMQGHSYERSLESPRSKCSGIVKSVRSPSKKLSSAVVRASASSRSLPVTLLDPSISNLDQVSRYYIDYYNERICKLFIVYDSDRNPFRSLISFGLKDAVLQKAILALAARHHANQGQSFFQVQAPTSPGFINANRDALLFKHQAMEALTRVLGDEGMKKSDTTVATIFLLIFLDLLESGSEGWNFHLEGAKSLIMSHQSLPGSEAGVNNGPGQTVKEIRGFITSQIHVIETLGATLLRPKLLSEFLAPDQGENPTQEAIEKSFLGCPEFLLGAIQFLSKERDAIAAKLPDDTAIQTHIQDTSYMLELIHQFDCYAWASNLQSSKQSPSDAVDELCTLSQVFKLGALLYGRRVLDALTETITEQDDLLSELLGLIDVLEDHEALFKCVLWAIFVAGLECQTQAQQTFLVGSLERFWIATSCLNVINAAKILKEYWDQRERMGSPPRWIFDIGNLGHDCLLI
ncbi:hypothetical protein N7535_000387 [Penicillium sp. DV-2018c]|nr:hypothetical protein N7535_000387 [Penicillium sp. DV-2018c]